MSQKFKNILLANGGENRTRLKSQLEETITWFYSPVIVDLFHITHVKPTA
jgi:hypothetical protein